MVAGDPARLAAVLPIRREGAAAPTQARPPVQAPTVAQAPAAKPPAPAVSRKLRTGVLFIDDNVLSYDLVSRALDGIMPCSSALSSSGGLKDAVDVVLRSISTENRYSDHKIIIIVASSTNTEAIEQAERLSRELPHHHVVLVVPGYRAEKPAKTRFHFFDHVIGHTELLAIAERVNLVEVVAGQKI